MKRILFILTFAFSNTAFSQSCNVSTTIPNQLLSTGGIWPDTIVNLPPSQTNSYNQSLNIFFTNQITPQQDPSGSFVGSTVQNYSISNVYGLPAGISYACSNSSCNYAGGQAGCINFYGSSSPGVYEITIEFTVYVLINLFPGLPPTPITQTILYPGYKIIIGGPITSSIFSTSESTNLCSGQNLNCQISVNGGLSPYNAIISDGINNFSFTGNSPLNVSLSPINSGQYSVVSLIDSFGNQCVNNSGTININVIEPNDSIYTLGPLNFCSGLNTTLIAQNPFGNNFQWYKNNIPIVGAVSFSYTTGSNASGNYFLESSIGNCISNSNTMVISTFSNAYQFSETVCGGPFVWNNQSYSTSGSYTQTFQAANGCDSIVTLNLTIHNNNFNPNFNSNQQLFTSPPFAVQFSNTTPNLSNYTFTWFWGDGTSTTSNNATVFHEYLNNGLYTVTLEAVNNSTGCIDETTLTDYIFTTGGASCTHAATINQTGPINGCSGQPIILSCNSDPSFTYQWRRNGIYIQGNNNDTLVVNQSGSYTVIISVNGCPVSSAPVTVNISNISPPTITSSGTIQPCLGGSVTLTVSSGFTNYLWSNGSTSPSITVTSSGNYSVQGTGSNGCIASSVPYTVNASFLPTQNICVVGVDSLTNNIRVVWEEPLTTAIDSFLIYKESNVSNVYTQVGSRAYDSLSVWIDPVSNPAVQAYRYKITALDTCGVETPLGDFHKTIHLTINQGVGGAWNLIWSHYEGISFGSYNIYRGTSSSNMTLLTTIQSNLNSYSDLTPPTGNIYYQVEILNPNTCTPTKSTNYSSSKSNIVNNTQGSINELTEEVMRIYPNPTNSKLTIEISNGLIGKGYSITDFSGRELRSSIFNSVQEKIELNSLSNGVYFIQVRGSNIQQRIIKQ